MNYIIDIIDNVKTMFVLIGPITIIVGSIFSLAAFTEELLSKKVIIKIFFYIFIYWYIFNIIECILPSSVFYNKCLELIYD